MAAPKQNTTEAKVIPFLRPNFSTRGNVKRAPRTHPAWNVETMFPEKLVR